MADRRFGVLRALASVLASAALLLAMPAALVHESAFLGSARRLLPPGGVGRAWHALLQPPDAATWHAVLVTALWAVWVWLVACLIAELVTGAARVAGSTRRAAKRPRERGPGRALASLLVGPLLMVLVAQGRHPTTTRSVAGAVGVPARDVVPAPLPRAAPSSARPQPPPAVPAVVPPATAAGGGHGSLPSLLAGLGGALVAVAVEELRRLADGRELRRLRRAVGPDQDADDQEPPAPAPPPGPREAAAVERADIHPAGDADRPRAGDVRVRLLGEPFVEGAPGPFDRLKVVESLAYLVLHPDGVAKQRWATALWPDRALSPNSLNTAVWQLRRALGTDARGERHLPAARSGRLRLGPGVRTDVAELEALATEGSTESLRVALDLVRGRAFDGLGDPDWIVLEGHASRIEEAVSGVALALGERLLAARDWPGAAAAARRGLVACPYDERLYRLLADAANGAGNRAAAGAALDELRRAVGTADLSTSRAG